MHSGDPDLIGLSSHVKNMVRYSADIHVQFMCVHVHAHTQGVRPVEPHVYVPNSYSKAVRIALC
jgi:hypothetical protein